MKGTRKKPLSSSGLKMAAPAVADKYMGIK